MLTFLFPLIGVMENKKATKYMVAAVQAVVISAATIDNKPEP